MRRSHRLSAKHESRLASRAGIEIIEQTVPDATAELNAAVPSTVTKAIAALATPCLPSPSIFPEDWRMISELLHDGQVSFSTMSLQLWCLLALYFNIALLLKHCLHNACATTSYHHLHCVDQYGHIAILTAIVIIAKDLCKLIAQLLVHMHVFLLIDHPRK